MGRRDSHTQVAESVPYDNASSGLASDDVQAAIDELTASLTAQDYAFFPIWAEENAALGNGQREWSFGNGATGDIGIVIPVDAQLYAVSYNAETAGTNTEIAVIQNTSTQVGTTGPQSGQDGFVLLGPPVQLNAGDRIGFQTITAGGASDVRVCAWLRVPSSLVISLNLGDLDDVTLAGETANQFIAYNGTQWVNIDPEASRITYDNTLSGLTATNVQDAIDEVEARVDTAESDITELELNQDDLITLSGVPENSVDLGTFTGITIPDNSNNKQAFQALETGLETHINDTANPHGTTFTQAVAADPGTDITAAEAEELTDGSTTQLHFHRELVDETGTNRVEVLNGGDVQLSNYPQTRNDTTSNDEKVLTTDNSGNIVLRRVLPFYDSIKKISNAVDQAGINQTTTFETYLELSTTIPEDGNYDIDWRYVWSFNDGAQDFLSQILLDGSPISTFNQHVQEPKDAAGTGIVLLTTTGGTANTGTNQRHRLSDFEPEVFLTAGVHTITIQWAGSQENDEAAIYEGAIRIKRVS